MRTLIVIEGISILALSACDDSRATPPKNRPQAPTAAPLAEPAQKPLREPVRHCGCPACEGVAGALLQMPADPIRLLANPYRGDDAARDELHVYLQRKLSKEGFRVLKERGFSGAGRAFDVLVTDSAGRPIAVFEIETREEVGFTEMRGETARQWRELAEICASQTPPVPLHFVVPENWTDREGRSRPTRSIADAFVFLNEDPLLGRWRRERGQAYAVWSWTKW